MMYGFHLENTDLSYRSEDFGKRARVVRVWSDAYAEYNYRLYHLYKGLLGLGRKVWIEQYSTDKLDKAIKWAKYYKVEIEE